jgi:hypothetical protein
LRLRADSDKNKRIKISRGGLHLRADSDKNKRIKIGRGGGTGRRACLRSMYRKMWRFHYLHKISNTLNVTVDLKILDETKISNHKYSIDFEFKKQDGKFIEFYTAYDSGDPREDGECFKTEKSDLLCQLLGNFEELLNISDIVFSSSSRNYTCFELSL